MDILDKFNTRSDFVGEKLLIEGPFEKQIGVWWCCTGISHRENKGQDYVKRILTIWTLR